MKQPPDQLAFDFDAPAPRSNTILDMPAKSAKLAEIIALPLDRRRDVVERLAFAVLGGRTAFDCDMALLDGLDAQRAQLRALGIPPVKIDAEIRKLHIAVDLTIRGILSPVRTTA